MQCVIVATAVADPVDEGRSKGIREGLMFQLVRQTEPHTQEAAEQGVVAVADTDADLCQNHARASACNRHADTTAVREERSCQRRSGAGIHAWMGWGKASCMDGVGARIHAWMGRGQAYTWMYGVGAPG